MPERFLRRVGTDAGLVLLSRLASAVALLVLTPFVVSELGKPAYGVWIIVSAATGLVGLVDLGVAPAVSRLVAFAHARDDPAAIRSAAATAALTSLALAVPLIAVGWLAAAPLARLLDVPPGLERDAAEALRIAVVTFCVTAQCAVMEGVLIGRRRFRALLAVRLTYVVGFVLGAILVLRSGGGVVGLAASQAAAMALALGVGAAVGWPSMRPRRGSLDRATLRQLLRFGLPQQASRVAYAGALQYERLLVGIAIGATAAAEYGAASTLVAALCSLLAQSTIALVPAFTQLRSRQPDGLADAFRRSSDMFTAIAAGTMGALAAVAAPLVTGWLGHGFSSTARFMQILAVGYLLWAVAHPGFALMQALGRPGVEGRAAGVVVLVDVVLVSVLVASVGTDAVAVGTSAALALGALAFWRLAAASGALARARLGSLARCAGPAALLAVVVAAANALVVPLDALGRLDALALAAAETALFTLAYLAALVRLGQISRPAIGRGTAGSSELEAA